MTGPTTDHAEIRRWADRQRAAPMEIQQHVFDSEPSRLHFVFGKTTVDPRELKAISWEQFFAVFDLLGLALVYDDTQFEFLQVEKRSAYRFDGKPM